MPTIDLTAYREKLALLESNFEINRQRIAEKVKEPSKTISLEDTDTLLLEIGSMIDEINKQIKANNDVISAKRSSKAKCKTCLLYTSSMRQIEGLTGFHRMFIACPRTAGYSDVYKRQVYIISEYPLFNAHLEKLNRTV